ncbi:beta-ketoacyl-ACP synthase III [Lederbergia galactosidilytica]|uniref:3-oxoacyl-ACP synthase n=1 Tax=Lederbergia galactosidilytica TaxID=217031 RepID=A0A0Q9YIZ9_9BACI|nr:beta-ketoacyl-ACP synthase III [Lederbergia galactosidilytica]KRG16645.1 3-oxoacyl-ACP synthase [Virgibacillus soli]KRG16695.1 3-oxoacyl-ACP synthase [Lederbergia galactosidilytica]MBP1915723.1 3-oxoacyl-[acyl-carrier-protein] synthase-3 [Lederbergia galactosidilytica]OAK67770.1 3-oxoacyl-ACP synthase [Lederbergia galactosidilytica]
MNRKVKIVGVGKYLPPKVVTAEELDQMLQTQPGWTLKKSGVKERHYVNGETASQMAANAALEAINDAGLSLSDVDCIISGSGTMEQPIPCNAALIQRALNLSDSGVPCFDVNTTCLSFVQALDIASLYLEMGIYRTILIVSSEIASIGLNWQQKESCVLFGDGAAAVVVQKTPENEGSTVYPMKMETYSDGASFTEIRGGGTTIHPREHREETKQEFLFHMNGPAVFRMSSKRLPEFVGKIFAEANISMTDLQAVIPHQASGMAMRLMKRKLHIPDEIFIDVIENYGNMIAASIPIALYEAIRSQRIKRGDKVLLIGTSAGLSLGGIILEY